MDIFSMVRTLGALGLVLGMLAGSLWAVRRYDLKLPGRIAGGRGKRVELVERLTVDAKRSVALIRRDGCEHLILMGPEGHAMIETGITTAPTTPAQAVASPPQPAPQPEPVAALEPAPVAPQPAPVVPAFETYIDLPPVQRPHAPRRPRARAPRVTARWNRAAVREALNA
ncbi:flagellar biosynthetic protein FliO [Sphingomonas hengshuiensis]|uniref:flagellar biosynthetic protein FliO n=1 Tax=Sphingomonas hengshuiensis TaxID=1609977 RepID=UPI0009821D7E|nr:flagellar biosynthetic protein FliO [Sphingomonas hengshuiensis]